MAGVKIGEIKFKTERLHVFRAVIRAAGLYRACLLISFSGEVCEGPFRNNNTDKKKECLKVRDREEGKLMSFRMSGEERVFPSPRAPS